MPFRIIKNDITRVKADAIVNAANSSCYKNSLELAREKGCESIAFPLISSGIYGYPKEKALQVAVSAIRDFLQGNDMDVTLVLLDKSAIAPNSEVISSVRSYIDKNMSPRLSSPIPPAAEKKNIFRSRSAKSSIPEPWRKENTADADMACSYECAAAPMAAFEEDIFDELDESFSEALLRMIDERGLTDPQVYKKANIDRRLFSKIRSDKNYKPSKATAVAFAIALELDMIQTRSLLEKAGFTLSDSIKFNVIIKYFIEKHDYDIFTINETLFAFDQQLIGS